RKLLRLQSQFLKKCKARERIERAKRRMVLDMLKQGITLEKYKEMYERDRQNHLNQSCHAECRM
ncbi:MAG: hypothetical protein DI586_09820, partial [Micavibrio aeruginosavorus]